MKLHNLTEILFNHANWGFIKITKFQIEGPRERTPLKNVFQELIRLGLFSGGYASFSDETDPNTGEKSGKLYYGKYRLDNLEISDLKEYRFQDFTQRISDSIKEQMDYSVKFIDTVFDSTLVIKIKDEFLNTIHLDTVKYFELDINETSEKINMSLSGIWDYFKCFIIYDENLSFVCRIEMGRD